MQHVRRSIVLPALIAAAFAQQRNAPTIPRQPLGPGPFIFDTAEQHKIRVVILTKGLSHPWEMQNLSLQILMDSPEPGKWGGNGQEYVDPEDFRYTEAAQLTYTLTRPDVYNAIMAIPGYAWKFEEELGVDKSKGMD